VILGVPGFLARAHHWCAETGTVVLGVIGILMLVGYYSEHRVYLKKAYKASFRTCVIGMALSFAIGLWFWLVFVVLIGASVVVAYHDIHKQEK
jgi:hypothetical protein